MYKRGLVEKEVDKEQTMSAGFSTGEKGVDVYKQLSREEIDSILEFLSEKLHLSSEDLLRFARKNGGADFSIPLELFASRMFSPLQVLVRYLIDEKQYSFEKISYLLGKPASGIRKVYVQSTKNGFLIEQKDTHSSKSTMDIPVQVFSVPDLSVLENLIFFLKVEKKMRYSEISLLLHRDARTIWTTYNRAKDKLTKRGYA